MKPNQRDAKWRKHVLAYDPFLGDFGDSSDTTLQDAIVRPRKRHDCGMCWGRVLKGTLTRVVVAVIDGDLCRCRFCQDCCDAMAFESKGGDCADPQGTEARIAFQHQRKRRRA